jgi:hypothetical protein
MLESFKSMWTATLVIRLSDEVASWFHFIFFQVRQYELPISLDAIRCNKFSMRTEDFLRLGKRIVVLSIWVMYVRGMIRKVR